MLLSYFSNKRLINKMASSGSNFLFLTSRREYYETIRSGADKCAQVALLWSPAVLGNFNKRGEALEEQYGEKHPAHLGRQTPNVFVLFDNEKFRSQRLLVETSRFPGVPLFSVIDTDSLVVRSMFPIFGNDDSCMSLYFYSIFVAHCIVSGGRISKPERIYYGDDELQNIKG